MNNILFVYGSLRRGDYNHSRTALGEANYLGTARVPGFYLLHCGSYPAAVRTITPDGTSVVVDVYDVSGYDMTFIDLMEQGAGYDKESVTAEDGTEGMMYVMNDEDHLYYFDCPVEPDEDGVYDWIKHREAA